MKKEIIIMSRTRRHFTSKFKSDLVIELLKGEKDLNTLAAENEILPNLLRNWKNEFLSKASIIFDDPERTTSIKNSRPSGRRKPPMPAKLANSPCRWIG
jgi:transposase-like protein